MNLPSLQEAKIDIEQTNLDFSFLRNVKIALESLLHSSQVENKEDYKRFRNKIDADIYNGMELVRKIECMIAEGKII